jgi:hypothetical protein
VSDGSRADLGIVSPDRISSPGCADPPRESGCGAALRPISSRGTSCQVRSRATWLSNGAWGRAGRVPDLRYAHSAAPTKTGGSCSYLRARGAVTQCRSLWTGSGRAGCKKMEIGGLRIAVCDK